MKNKRLLGIAISVVLILLIPFIAMFFTDEVNWSAGDFAVAAVLLFGTGLMIEYSIRMIKNRTYRIPIIFAIVVLLLLVWAELAVGIFGTPLAGS